ncbi:hypothetical protein Syun_016289 [Stephania yunnanensis]|uniref:Uncharacterized protein n=1 Tax=Stephania yunnanensis TaxID=152371 RepID=A0AAP0P183_9MAGN
MKTEMRQSNKNTRYSANSETCCQRELAKYNAEELNSAADHLFSHVEQLGSPYLQG